MGLWCRIQNQMIVSLTVIFVPGFTCFSLGFYLFVYWLELCSPTNYCFKPHPSHIVGGLWPHIELNWMLLFWTKWFMSITTDTK